MPNRVSVDPGTRAQQISKARRRLPRHLADAAQAVGKVHGTTGPLKIHTDGSVSRKPIANGYGRITGWGYLATDGHFGCGKVLQFDTAGNDPAAVTELRAIWHALRNRPNTPVTVITDSQHAADIMTGWKNGGTRMPSGYTGSRIPRYVPTLEQLRLLVAAHTDHITVEWIKGHAGHTLNEGADALAQLGMRWARDALTEDDVTKRAAGIAQGFLDQWRSE